MRSAPPNSVIRLQGVRQNNLKDFDLDIPLGKLVVVTGLSGSGKSSLAFDTLYAEGQRRYIETFSPYARQFFDRMDKPQVRSIHGIPPAIALDQRNAVRTTRSTVGTMTEICDYMKTLWPHLATLFCRQCGREVRKETPSMVWAECEKGVSACPDDAEIAVTFDLDLSEKLDLSESIELIRKQGYQRILGPANDRGQSRAIESIARDTYPEHASSTAALHDHIPDSTSMNPGGKTSGQFCFETIRLEDALPELARHAPKSLTVVQDRLPLHAGNRARLVEACEQAYHFGKGRLAIHHLRSGKIRRFSQARHCAECDIDYREPSPALFSFNNPVGACPACRGFGRTISIDYRLAMPDLSLSIDEGLIKPWQAGHGLESQTDLRRFCRARRVSTTTPFRDLPKETQTWIVEGDPGYGTDSAHEWPRAWYGLKGYFRWLESKAYKMHVRVLLSRYRTYQTCSVCSGRRFQPDSLQFKVTDMAGHAITLADFYQLPISQALSFVRHAAQYKINQPSDPIRLCLQEVVSRLGFLEEAGLSYLTLDRPTRTLSGGETERVNLTTCLGSRLVNTLFVLDEPSVGLHTRDTARLIQILQRLRKAGNTLVVVEHDASVMRAADQIVDLGPGHGSSGGEVVFQGPYEQIVKARQSITGAYLSGAKQILPPQRRKVDLRSDPKLVLSQGTLHNLKEIRVEIPLRRLVCITGVSGSGKSSLVRGLLYPTLLARTRTSPGGDADISEGEESPDTAETQDGSPPARCLLEGGELINGVILADQSSLGRTPRSNPVVYIGAFEDIRDLFAHTESARQRDLNRSAFSFNSRIGQCEKCRGAGFEKIEMQFLSDIFIRCAECNGRRYRPHILEIKLLPPAADNLPSPPLDGKKKPKAGRSAAEGKSIADMLECTVDDAIAFLELFPKARRAGRAVTALRQLRDVGLGYLKLGQPINTLSGGESQRLKLAGHLAEFSRRAEHRSRNSLFLFDEPTTGLHFEDVRILLEVFARLVDDGHTVVIIEHNLDVIGYADWVIDLGPEAGEQGGRVVVAGPPEAVGECLDSHTGQALKAARQRPNVPISDQSKAES